MAVKTIDCKLYNEKKNTTQNYLLTVKVQVIVQILVFLRKKSPHAVRLFLNILFHALLHRVEQESAEHVGVYVLHHFNQVDVIEFESGGELI